MHRVNGYFRPARGTRVSIRGQITVPARPIKPRPPTVTCEGCGGRGIVPVDDPELPDPPERYYGQCPACAGAGGMELGASSPLPTVAAR